MPHQCDDDRRARLADPATPETVIARLGIHTVAELGAAMARNPKGPVLLGALLDFFADAGAGLRIDDHIIELIGEPALNAEHLATATTVMYRRHGPAYARLAAAICCHALASPHTVIGALWNAPTALCQDVARARGDLLPAATGWVRLTEPDDTDYATVRELAAGPKGALIKNTAALWSAWTGTDPARFTFLITSCGSFDTCEQLLAGGAAITAAPGRT